MNLALSPNLVFRALLPNTMQWAGNDFGPATPPSANGNNYVFTATQLLIRNYETNRYYLLQTTWEPGVEELKYETEVVTPTPAGAIPDSGTNFEFTADGYLRIKHESSGNFHNLTTWNGLQTVVGPGVASNAGTFASQGNNYRFSSNTLQFLDEGNGQYYTLWLVGQHGGQQTELS